MSDSTYSSLPAINHLAAQQLWEEYLAAFDGAERPREYTAECFGDSPELADELLHAVSHGAKRATSSLEIEYAQFDEPLPEVGRYWMICDGRGQPQLITRVSSVEKRSFYDVDADFAAAEGEGDLSLEYWRREHEAFWRRTQGSMGNEWSPSDTDKPGHKVIMERFEVCWPLKFAH
ncbi:ASCH domain-containing protein [Glutamicibacter endophyticus]|uniref:ASCH domain-containing protein n=1 Tax=Glutamicibacter endophyticus TaxID=1522174 RepID=UPI003AEF1A4A